ncbi:MAG: Hsp20/alpha crystallin family protein [bacterium]|nr:Hsp20/alpha crystallin family protein [bacterium]
MNNKNLSIQKEENIFFQKLTPGISEPELWPLASEGELAVDVYETDKDVVIKAAIAGVKSDDINLNLEGDLLTIRGTRRDDEKENRNYFCQECYFGPFSRSVILPTHVKTDKARAQLQRGILIITLPKNKKETKIPIKTLEE